MLKPRVNPASLTEGPYYPVDNEFISVLYDELRTAVDLDRQCTDPFLLLHTQRFDRGLRGFLEELTDDCVVEVDASEEGFTSRSPLGLFFCVNGKGTIDGLDPEIRRLYGLSKEEASFVRGFYFIPAEQFTHDRLHNARFLYHTIHYTPPAETELSEVPYLTVDALNIIANERERKRKEAESEFFGRSHSKDDYDHSLDVQADRAAEAAENRARRKRQKTQPAPPQIVGPEDIPIIVSPEAQPSIDLILPTIHEGMRVG